MYDIFDTTYVFGIVNDVGTTEYYWKISGFCKRDNIQSIIIMMSPHHQNTASDQKKMELKAIMEKLRKNNVSIQRFEEIVQHLNVVSTKYTKWYWSRWKKKLVPIPTNTLYKKMPKYLCMRVPNMDWSLVENWKKTMSSLFLWAILK